MIIPRFMVITVPSPPENNIYIPVDNFICKIIESKGDSNGRRVVHGFSISYRNIVIFIIISIAGTIIIVSVLIIITRILRTHNNGHRNTSPKSKNKEY
jgi:hypothetical protein